MSTLDTFHRLPGTDGTARQGPTLNRAEDIMTAIGEHPVCATAGNNGSVTVWRDDDGHVRAMFQRYHQTLDNIVNPSDSELQDWLTTWLPQCGDMV